MTTASADRRYDEAVRSLLSLPRFADQGAAAYRPGLKRVHALLQAMGRPQDEYPIVHVAGTNGKGTVASFVASILNAAGLKTGLHTSPHLHDVEERMRVNGVPADREWLGEQVARYHPEMQRIGPSFFEMTVALSLLRFADEGVDAAVVEVGLGGRLDATNAVQPVLSVITNVGMDHTEILGDSIERIAAEKAGIIKDHVPVFVAVEPAADTVIRTVAADRAAPYENVRTTCSFDTERLALEGSTVTVHSPSRNYRNVRIDLPMEHQIWNAVLATRSGEQLADILGFASDIDIFIRGVEEVRSRAGLRGRFEVLQRRPLVIADVAHNAEGIGALVRHVQLRSGSGRLHVCLAMMKDKRMEGVASLLKEVGAHVMAVSVDSHRAFPSTALAELLKQPDLQVDILDTVGNAVDTFLSAAAPEDVLIVTGSHLAVDEAQRLSGADTNQPETRLQ